MGLFDRFRKDSVKDPFGGDDDEDFYDDDQGQSGAGPKIALLASGVVFAGVVGFISYVLLTSETPQVAAPVTGNFADLEVVDENTPAPAAGAPVAQDATAATDRSASRRPWLTAQAPAKPDAAKPTATPPAAAKPEAAKPETAKPAVTPPANTAAVTPPPPAPAAAKPAAPVAAPAKEPQVAAAPSAAKPAAPPPPVPANAKPVAPPPAGARPEATPADAPAQPSEEVPSLIAGIPALNAPGVAPGAPERFAAAAGDAGPAVAGGRPRLVDPPLPPTDRVAVSAPPPRFAALRDAKKDAAPAAASASTAKIAIVVRGLGLSQAATEAAITKLPPAVTLAFSPYARNIKTWMDRAKAAGHEVLIEVPLESKDFPAQDPGPLGLLTTLELKDNTERLDAVLKAGAGAIGVFDAQGTKFRENAQSITPMFAKLKEQNLFYVQGSPGVRMGDAYVSTAVADVVLDERPFRAAVDARLDYAERLARYQGSVVASAQAKPVSFERLLLWLDQAQRKGIALTPISAVLIRSEITPPPPPAATPANAKAKPAADHETPAQAKPAAAKAKPEAAKAKPEAAKAKAKPAH
jgi:polysaccharide deacetylase 2 family uncharacterized protein YibQ